ncbi:MAG TPA: phospholipase D-like domain-containing protein, partial [Candidatus Binatia bacterium]|nr:phospholipase D-like domain-containing protein [Candidatus Binatia bacterium]
KSRRAHSRSSVLYLARDMSGTLLFEEVRRAANRGVRVRLLSSLHAKTFSVDRERVFIGSFHFDPRSAELNTELGFVIHSPALAKESD